ncbi:unnamed protein product [Caenorhabditis brenneri]
MSSSLLVLLLVLSCSLVLGKCPSNSFCFAPENATTDITVSCNNKDETISLKWKTTEKRSTVLVNNGLNLLQFVCGFPTGTTNLNVKTYKIDVSENGNFTSCQVDFYQLNSLLKKDELSYLQWKKEKSVWFKFEEICNPRIEGLSKEVKRFLVKSHAILMLLGWLFFVPTGFLFARFGKQIFSDQKLVGMPVWFQIHRTSTFIGVFCICTSIFCIFASTNFTWKGTGSEAWYWTQWHTDLGTISTVLAISQPLNSLLRCPPSNSQRAIFNWSHRFVGMASYTFAVTAIYIAAANYRKTWSEPMMEIVLTSVPTVLCIGTAVMVWTLEKRKKRDGYKEVEMNEKPTLETNEESAQLFQVSWLFTIVGICFGCATSLSLLVANGFKND